MSKKKSIIGAYVVPPMYSKPFTKTIKVTDNNKQKPMNKREAQILANKLRKKYPNRRVSVEQNKSTRWSWWDYFVRIQIGPNKRKKRKERKK